jgi:hypothetical protein
MNTKGGENQDKKGELGFHNSVLRKGEISFSDGERGKYEFSCVQDQFFSIERKDYGSVDGHLDVVIVYICPLFTNKRTVHTRCRYSTGCL